MAAENFKVKKGLEVGTAITATSSGVNVTGIVTATQFVGDGSGLTGVTGSGSGVVVKDEGSAVGTAGTINFVGSGVAATLSLGTATITINAGGLDNVVEDTTPQLGGNLDLNGKFVNGTGGANITGVVTATTLKGNGDFVDIDVDGRADLDDLVIAGVSTFSGVINANNGINLTSADNKSILLGASDDMRIRHTGSHSEITDEGTGDLRLGSNRTVIGDATFSETQAKFIQNGAVELYHDNIKRLETSSVGVSIPQDLDVDGRTDLDDLVVSGVGTFSTRIDTNGVSFGTNTTTFSAKFADNAVANFGTDNDLKISHDNVHARITNSTGDIVVVGIISATSDVKVGSAITMDPTSGIITATAFHGDGSNLTGISGGGGSVTSDAQENTVGGTNAGDSFDGTNALRNTLFGHDAGTSITSSDDGTAVGHNALGSMMGGARNTAFGSEAGSHITNSDNNTCIGYQAGADGPNLINGVNCILLGYQASPTATNSSNEVTIGNNQITKFRIPGINFTLKDNGGTPTQGHVLTVDANGEAGFAAASGGGGTSLTTDSQGNTVGGTNSGDSFSTGGFGSGATNNNLFGFDTGTDITSGWDNNCFGYQAGANITTGNNNICIGQQAGFDQTIQNKLIAIGNRAAYNNAVTTTIAIGYRSLYTNVTGTSNCMIGEEAGYSLTGSYNIAYGAFAMRNAGAANNNIAIGHQAMQSISTGARNIALGYGAGNGTLSTGSNNIMIGYDVDASASDVSNEITLGDANISHLRVPGIGLTFTSSGALISGIATATSFSGSGASLTALNASNLGSGTIPNGRFPATLPATSGVNLTALNASEITSGTLPIARIADDAVTFAKMQNVGTGVFIGRNDGGTGDIETLTAAEARTLLNVADGATAGITTSVDNVTGTWSVTANGSSAYRFTGPGQSGNEDNPDIYLVRGQRYSFINTTGSSHPFRFRVSSGGSTYSDGVSGSENGTQYFNVQHDAPASLVYQCTIHGGMVGNIYIVGQHLANGANNLVLTATSAYGMNGEANLTFDGSTLSSNDGSGDGTVKIGGSNTGTGATLFYDISGSTYLRIKNLYRSNASNGNGAYIEYDAGYHKFLSSKDGTERLRITSDGDVLIGKTSGDHILDINASSDEIRLSKASASDYTGIQLDRDASGTAGGYFGLAGNTNHYITGSAQHDICVRSQANLLFSTSGATERLRIASDGVATFSATNINVNRNAGDAFIALQTSGTSNVSLYGGASSGFRVFTNDSGLGERFRIDSSGFVSIGRAASAQAFNHASSGITNTMFEVVASDASNSIFESATFRGGADHNGAGARVRLVHSGDRGLVLEGGRTSNAAFGAIGLTDQNGDITSSVHINSSGTWFWNKTSQSSGTAGVELYKDGPNFMTRNGTTVLGLNNQSGTTGDIMRFYYQDAHRGNLNYNGSTFAATTASDYRLKENDVPITDGIERVKQLRPIRFNFKKDSSKTLDGFFAHEVQKIVPDCVTGEKDAEISEKGEGYQHISKEGLIPLLTAALKEEIAKREALEARIAALEGS